MAAVKEDCFAYAKASKCSCNALRQLYCEKEECGFYKTKEQHEKDTKKRGVQR